MKKLLYSLLLLTTINIYSMDNTCDAATAENKMYVSTQPILFHDQLKDAIEQSAIHEVVYLLNAKVDPLQTLNEHDISCLQFAKTVLDTKKESRTAKIIYAMLEYQAKKIMPLSK